MSTATQLEVSKFHLSLNVNDLAKTVKFLTALFNAPPKKLRSDYAKFEPEDLPLVLSLEPRSTPQSPLRSIAGEGALNHVGIRMTDAAQLVGVQRRLEMAGFATQRENGVECCYSRQTKFWVHDHDQTLWEVYVLDEDIEHRGGAHESLATVQRPVAATPLPLGSATKTWQHMLHEDFPESVAEAGTLDEVVMQGSWNSQRHQGTWTAQLERVRTGLRPGGRIVLHLLTADREVTNLAPLPGPAAVVQVVPLLGEILDELDAAGFVNVQLLKYDSSPCFVQQGISLRETRLEAFTKPAEHHLESLVNVVYKGPAAKVVDDSGLTFWRGTATLVPTRTWQRIAASPMSESFVKLAEPSNKPASCGISPAKR